jgi:hypothetical protein
MDFVIAFLVPIIWAGMYVFLAYAIDSLMDLMDH